MNKGGVEWWFTTREDHDGNIEGVLPPDELPELSASDSAETDAPAVMHVRTDLGFPGAEIDLTLVPAKHAKTQKEVCDCPLCTYTPVKTEAG
jgi:hypothetical protein